MNIGEKSYCQPRTEAELIEVLGQMTENSCILAGGTDLLIELRDKRPQVDLVLSLCGLTEWTKIRQEGDWLVIGAMAVHEDIARNSLVKQYARALSMSCASVGSRQIRNKGTIGGSLGNASPAGDMMPCLFLLHGKVELLDAQGVSRLVPAEEFLNAGGKTILTPGVVIRSIWLPIQPERDSCFVKLGSRREVTIAQISLGLAWTRQEDRHEALEAVIGAVDRRPLWVPEAAELLAPYPVSDEAKDQLSQILAQRIQAIRLNRTRPPKLKITEAERLYKERAVRGVVYDVVDAMEPDHPAEA